VVRSSAASDVYKRQLPFREFGSELSQPSEKCQQA
jgi:hypothetical protein